MTVPPLPVPRRTAPARRELSSSDGGHRSGGLEGRQTSGAAKASTGGHGRRGIGRKARNMRKNPPEGVGGPSVGALGRCDGEPASTRPPRRSSKRRPRARPPPPPPPPPPPAGPRPPAGGRPAAPPSGGAAPARARTARRSSIQAA